MTGSSEISFLQLNLFLYWKLINRYSDKNSEDLNKMLHNKGMTVLKIFILGGISSDIWLEI